MAYQSLSPESAAVKIKSLIEARGKLTCSELVFYGGMTDAAVQRGIRHLQQEGYHESEKLPVTHPESAAMPEKEKIGMELKVGLLPPIGELATYERALQFLENMFHELSEPESQFNQNFVTPDTSVRRILYAAMRDSLKGKKLYFLGDDDLTSIVAAYLYPESDVYALDIDKQLLSSLDACAQKYGLKNLHTIEYNAFNELPAHLRHQADVAWCDPSKDVLDVFLRNASALIKDDGVIYTFAQPEYLPKSKKFFETMLKYNTIATDIIPRFNQYCGAGQHSRSQAITRGFQLAFTESLVRLIKVPA